MKYYIYKYAPNQHMQRTVKAALLRSADVGVIWLMRIMIKLKLVSLLLMIPFSVNAGDWASTYASESLKNMIIISAEKSLVTGKSNEIDINGLIIALYLVSKKESDIALIDLSEYNIGASGIEDLNAAITNRGENMIGYINNKISMPVLCKSSSICLSKTERDERLNYWLQLISNNQKVEFNE